LPLPLCGRGGHDLAVAAFLDDSSSPNPDGDAENRLAAITYAAQPAKQTSFSDDGLSRHPRSPRRFRAARVRPFYL